MQRIRNDIFLVPISRLHAPNGGFRSLSKRLRGNIELIMIVGEVWRTIIDVDNIYMK